MAKRKRLGAPNPALSVAPSPEAHTGGPLGKAPIAGVAADAATAAALDEMASELSAARREGRMIATLPLEAVEMDYLVRDRISQDDEAMQALMASLQARGQQVPIEVAELAPGRYGLISGWRRCQALIRLNRDTVKVIIRQPQEASEAYLSMVEENEIRVGLSYYERARIVVKATEQGVFPDTRAALSTLFQTGSRARRSKIGTFVHIVEALDGALRFPAALTERVGLTLGRALQDDPELGVTMAAALRQAAPDTPGAEAAYLSGCTPKPESEKAKAEPDPRPAPAQPCPGIKVKTHKDGSLTLRGAGVDAALRSRLLAWLAAQG